MTVLTCELPSCPNPRCIPPRNPVVLCGEFWAAKTHGELKSKSMQMRNRAPILKWHSI